MVNKEMSRSRRAFYLIDFFSHKTLDFLAVEAMNINAEKAMQTPAPSLHRPESYLTKIVFFKQVQ